MSDAPCPPFRDIVAYLFCSMLAVSMILYLLPWLLREDLQAWVFFALFLAIIIYCCVQLASGLFPSRWRRCSGSALVKRIVEIEQAR